MEKWTKEEKMVLFEIGFNTSSAMTKHKRMVLADCSLLCAFIIL